MSLTIAVRGELLEPLAALVPLRVGVVLHLIYQPLSSAEVRLSEGVGDVVEIKNNGKRDKADKRGSCNKGNAGFVVVDVGNGPECLLKCKQCVSNRWS